MPAAIACSPASRGNAVILNLAAPYGISVSDSTGSVLTTGLTGRGPAEPSTSFQPGICLPLTISSTGAPSVAERELAQGPGHDPNRLPKIGRVKNQPVVPRAWWAALPSRRRVTWPDETSHGRAFAIVLRF